MRMWRVVGALGLVGCGEVVIVSIPNPPDDSTTLDGGTDALDAPIESAPSTDAGIETPDAPYVGPGCADDDAAVSDQCFIDRLCTSDECGAPDSILYQCANSGGGTRPRAFDCNYVGINNNVGTAGGQLFMWCCPPACVHYKQNDGDCVAGRRFFFCPNFPDGGPRLEASGSCEKISTGKPREGYCCPF